MNLVPGLYKEKKFNDLDPCNTSCQTRSNDESAVLNKIPCSTTIVSSEKTNDFTSRVSNTATNGGCVVTAGSDVSVSTSLVNEFLPLAKASNPFMSASGMLSDSNQKANPENGIITSNFEKHSANPSSSVQPIVRVSKDQSIGDEKQSLAFSSSVDAVNSISSNNELYNGILHPSSSSLANGFVHHQTLKQSSIINSNEGNGDIPNSYLHSSDSSSSSNVLVNNNVHPSLAMRIDNTCSIKSSINCSTAYRETFSMNNNTDNNNLVNVPYSVDVKKDAFSNQQSDVHRESFSNSHSGNNLHLANSGLLSNTFPLISSHGDMNLSHPNISPMLIHNQTSTKNVPENSIRMCSQPVSQFVPQTIINTHHKETHSQSNDSINELSRISSINCSPLPVSNSPHGLLPNSYQQNIPLAPNGAISGLSQHITMASPIPSTDFIQRPFTTINSNDRSLPIESSSNVANFTSGTLVENPNRNNEEFSTTYPHVLSKSDNNPTNSYISQSNGVTSNLTSLKDPRENNSKSNGNKKSRKQQSNSYLSKFTNANFKEVVDHPTTKQPITSLIHSQSAASKTSSEERRSSKKKSTKKKDSNGSTLSGDNSAVYGPLQDTSTLNGTGENVVAQPATSPIAALLMQSSLHNSFNNEVNSSCNDKQISSSYSETEVILHNATPVSQFGDSTCTPPLVASPSYGSSTRTVVSPASLFPSLSPTQSFAFPISACVTSSLTESHSSLLTPSSKSSSVNFINHNNSSAYVANISSLVSSHTHNVNAPLPNNSLCSNSFVPPSRPPSRSSSILTSSGSVSSVNYVSVPSPTSAYSRHNRNSFGNITPPPPFAYGNQNVFSIPRITSPVMNNDNSMLYTSSRIAAGLSMSPPLSSILLPGGANSPPNITSSVPGVPERVANSVSNAPSNNGRPLLSPSNMVGLPFSSISTDHANLEPPLPNSSVIPPLSELELTADDLPRLLSNGDSSNQSCGASKLLDTNTADLTEIIQKLQESTGSEVHHANPNPGPTFRGVLANKSDGSPCTAATSTAFGSCGSNSTVSVAINQSNQENLQEPSSLSSQIVPASKAFITSFTDALSSTLPYSVGARDLSPSQPGSPSSLLHRTLLYTSAPEISNMQHLPAVSCISKAVVHHGITNAMASCVSPSPDSCALSSSSIPATNINHPFSNF